MKNEGAIKDSMVEVVEVAMDDPTFESGSIHTATATFVNPKTAPLSYEAQIYLAKAVGGPAVATSPVVGFTINAGQTLAVQFPVTMPVLAQIQDNYKVYLAVLYGGVPLVTFVGVEDVVVYVDPAIQLVGIGWT